MSRIFFTVFLIIAITAVLPGLSIGNGPASKPRPSLEIAIVPTEETQQGAQAAGATVDLIVTARSLVDTDKATITLRLTGGVELVSGDTSWSGPLGKDEQKVMAISVQTPKKGKGTVRARMTLPSWPGASFSAEARYELGQEAMNAEKVRKEKPVKKDLKGREIIEYP